MAIKDDHFELLNPFARDRDTGKIVLVSAEFRISMYDGESEFYDKKTHKGHNLVCPCCEKAELYWRKGRGVAGDKRYVRDHFAKKPSSDHDPSCKIQEMILRAVENASNKDRYINPNKGAYAYANIEDVSAKQPVKRGNSSYTRSPQLPTFERPSWLRRVEYAKGRSGFPEIISPDFVDRKRHDSVSDINGFLRLIEETSTNLLKDTWVINKGVAVRLDAIILRDCKDNKRENITPEQKAQYHLRRDFLVAANGRDDRFAQLLNAQIQGVKIPVVLHFNTAAATDIKRTPFGRVPSVNIDLPSFQVENPKWLQGKGQSLALPFVDVSRRIHIKAPELLHKMAHLRKNDPTEYFALAHAYMFPREDGLGFRQHFDVLRECDIVPMGLHELADKVRSAQAKRNSTKTDGAESQVSPRVA